MGALVKDGLGNWEHWEFWDYWELWELWELFAPGYPGKIPCELPFFARSLPVLLVFPVFPELGQKSVPGRAEETGSQADYTEFSPGYAMK